MTTQRREQQTIAKAQQYPNGDYGNVCAYADNVAAHADDVSAHADDVASYVDSVTSDIKTLQQDISSVESAFASYEQALTALPAYQLSNPPSPAEVAQAVNTAQSAIAQVVATTNQDIDKANSMVASAYQEADAAYSAGHCGSGPSAPQPLSHISATS